MPLTNEDKLWIDERLEGLETRLLTAFQQWASPVESRMNSNRAALREFDITLEALQSRVKTLEERSLRQPPH